MFRKIRDTEYITNNFKCFTSIMTFEVLNIFEQKRLWLMVLNNPSYIKKQRSLYITAKSMCTPH